MKKQIEIFKVFYLTSLVYGFPLAKHFADDILARREGTKQKTKKDLSLIANHFSYLINPSVDVLK